MDENFSKDDVLLGDVFRPLIRYRRFIWQGSLAVTLVVAVLAGLYYAFQPTTWSAQVGFRPTFLRSTESQYPNLTPFSPTDITSSSIVEVVHGRNSLSGYCRLEDFRGGLVVQESSPDLQILSLQYQARLVDTTLTTVERQRLEEEYLTRRAAVPRGYELRYLQPIGCARIPEVVIFKTLTEVLETWAEESENKRGVMKLKVPLLTPGVYARAGDAEEPLLVRADLLRTTIGRVIDNIRRVQELAGADQVRLGENQITFAELRAELEDLLQARLDPLVATAGRGFGRESIRWTQQALQNSTNQLTAARQRADAYRQALREYSGASQAPPPPRPGEQRPPTSASDLQALTPQIDRTFVDRIVELSSSNTLFRQEITRRAIEAEVDAVNRALVVEHYRQLLSTMSQPAIDQLTAKEIEERVGRITEQARLVTKRFNDLYHEWSRVSLRAAGAMYTVIDPPASVAVRVFGLRDLVFLVLGVLLASPIIIAIGCLIHHHVRRFLATPSPATT